MRYTASLNEDNDLLLKGLRAVTTLQDLYAILILPDTTSVHITSEFADSYFTPSGLSDFVGNVKIVNPKIKVTTDADLLDFQLKDVRKLAGLTSVEDLIHVMLGNPGKFVQTLQLLCKSYQSAYSETLQANNRISTLQLQLSKQQAEQDALRENYNELTRQKNELESKLNILVSRVNSAYGKSVDSSYLLELPAHSYFKILYVKEITRVRYVDTLLFYLQEILKLTYGVPARFVVIEPFYAYERHSLYPRCTPHWELTYNDVHRSDIFMAGFQPKLLEDILRNSSNVEYLIVLDRAGLPKPHISAPYTEYIFTATELSDAENVPPDRVITYDRNGLNIPHVQNFSSLSGEEKMRSYSSFSVLKLLLELMERGKQSAG